MTRIFFDGRDLEIVLRRDGVEYVYPLASLAAVLRIESAVLAARLVALLKAGEDLSTGNASDGPSRESSPFGTMGGEPTEGTVPIRSDTVQRENLLNRSDTVPIPTVSVSATVGAHDLSPDAIARVLGDVPNTAAIAVLVRDLPQSLILDALHQALAIPATRLRSNRAALFTAIVRRMKGGSSSPDKTYARTPTSAP